MHQFDTTGQYDDLIKKIKTRRICVIAGMSVALISILILSLPMHIELFGKAYFSYNGIGFFASLLLFILVMLLTVISLAIVSLPAITSLDEECDPLKHLTLNTAFEKSQNLDLVYSTDLLFLGDFSSSRYYAEKMIASGKQKMIENGLFNKAFCAFFQKDFKLLRLTVSMYINCISAQEKQTKKKQEFNRKIQDALFLLSAIADNDKQKIELLRHRLEYWNNSKPAAGLVNYLKGISAFYVGDKNEAIYRLMAVKDTCNKTVLSAFSGWYLERLD